MTSYQDLIQLNAISFFTFYLKFESQNGLNYNGTEKPILDESMVSWLCYYILSWLVIISISLISRKKFKKSDKSVATTEKADKVKYDHQINEIFSL